MESENSGPNTTVVLQSTIIMQVIQQHWYKKLSEKSFPLRWSIFKMFHDMEELWEALLQLL
jgi:hypothetical protein